MVTPTTRVKRIESQVIGRPAHDSWITNTSRAATITMAPRVDRRSRVKRRCVTELTSRFSPENGGARHARRRAGRAPVRTSRLAQVHLDRVEVLGITVEGALLRGEDPHELAALHLHQHV